MEKCLQCPLPNPTQRMTDNNSSLIVFDIPWSISILKNKSIVSLQTFYAGVNVKLHMSLCSGQMVGCSHEMTKFLLDNNIFTHGALLVTCMPFTHGALLKNNNIQGFQ